MSTPMRRTRSPCCAHAASGHAAAPPSPAMNSRRLISSIGFLRTELSKLGRALSPSVLGSKDTTPRGRQDRLLHCGISAPSADGFMAEMGHKHRISVLLTQPLCRKWLQYLPNFCAPQRESLSAINRHNQQLFDHLGGAQQNRWGYLKTERLGRLEVHGHLELGRDGKRPTPLRISTK